MQPGENLIKIPVKAKLKPNACQNLYPLAENHILDTILCLSISLYSTGASSDLRSCFFCVGVNSKWSLHVQNRKKCGFWCCYLHSATFIFLYKRALFVVHFNKGKRGPKVWSCLLCILITAVYDLQACGLYRFVHSDVPWIMG